MKRAKPAVSGYYMFNDVKKILVVNLGGIGDVLLSTPALRAIRGAYPGARITALAVGRCRYLFEHMPYIDAFEEFMPGVSGALSDLSLILKLRRERFDLALNMRTIASRRGSRRMRSLFGVISPRVSAGRDTGGLGRFFDIRVDETLMGEKYEMEYDIDLARAVGAEVSDRSVSVPVDAESERAVGGLISRTNTLAGEKLIGVHPGGKPSHRWPIESFEELVRTLAERSQCRFVFTGSRDEAGLTRRLSLLAAGSSLDLGGRLDLGALSAVIKRCDLFVSGDTGAMHLAAALGTPLVAIFGPGYLKRFDPRNMMPGAAVICNRAPCAPCDREYCGDMRCLKSIPPSDVISASLDMLGKI